MSFKLEKILDRGLMLYGYEVLLDSGVNVFLKDCKSCFDDILLNQLDFLMLNAEVNGMKGRFFINVERFQLEDVFLLNKVCNRICDLHALGVSVYLELTERDYGTNLSVEYLMSIRDKFNFSFVADDVTLNDFRQDEILSGLYTIVKLEPCLIDSLSAELSNWMSLMKKEHGTKFLAEKIETYSMLDKALSLPMDYLQGFVFSEH